MTEHTRAPPVASENAVSCPEGRDSRGRFIAGNIYCYQGWHGLVQKRFGGNEAATREWWGKMGAYNSDAVYRIDGLGHMPYPGSPEEFMEQRRQSLETILLTIVEPLAF